MYPPRMINEDDVRYDSSMNEHTHVVNDEILNPSRV